MGDLLLHLPFARRLRLAEGLHPLACEAMVRRAPLLALGATLPVLPAAEHKGAGLFRRLFKRGAADADKWEKLLYNGEGARPDLIVDVLSPPAEEGPPGTMSRLALALGLLSNEVLTASVAETIKGLDSNDARNAQRGQARLWLQFAVPSLKDLAPEWQPALDLDRPERFESAITHLDGAIKSTHGEAPGRELLHRWLKGLAKEVRPLAEKSALPPSLGLADHQARSKYFEGDAAFVEKVQSATTWFVFLAGRLSDICVSNEPSRDDIKKAICNNKGELLTVPSSNKLKTELEAWGVRMHEVREKASSRGRNPKAAYHDEIPPLPTPAHTQEVSLAQIEDEIAVTGLSASGMASAEMLAQLQEAAQRSGKNPAAPRVTQTITAADIEGELEAKTEPNFKAPSDLGDGIEVEIDDSDVAGEKARAEGGDKAEKESQATAPAGDS